MEQVACIVLYCLGADDPIVQELLYYVSSAATVLLSVCVWNTLKHLPKQLAFSYLTYT